jgi:hypothetical protein
LRVVKSIFTKSKGGRNHLVRPGGSLFAPLEHGRWGTHKNTSMLLSVKLNIPTSLVPAFTLHGSSKIIARDRVLQIPHILETVTNTLQLGSTTVQSDYSCPQCIRSNTLSIFTPLLTVHRRHVRIERGAKVRNVKRDDVIVRSLSS